MTTKELNSLLNELLSLSGEREWFEYKHNWFQPEQVGEYVSALSNSASLKGQPYGYLIWGIDDSTRKIVGTKVRLDSEKKGNMEFSKWLSTMLVPRIVFDTFGWEVDGLHLELLRVEAARNQPVKFKGEGFFRINSSNTNLKDYPNIERKIWTAETPTRFEFASAAEDLSAKDVLNLLNTKSFYTLRKAEVSESPVRIIGDLLESKIINVDDNGKYTIPNYTALVLANQLSDFTHLERKAIRLIFYSGYNKVKGEREIIGRKGYAVGFEGLIQYMMDRLPQSEIIESALRVEMKMYPEVAIRELIANAMIHQDLCQSGTNPMIEVYKDRIEITNNGTPLIAPLRFIDEVPRSRNEFLAGLMRQFHICEERGSGIKRVVTLAEAYQLPPPDFQQLESHVRAVLYAPRPLAGMDRTERIRACYQHACLKFVSNDYLTNESLRKRFKIEEEKSYTTSRIIADTVEEGLIVPRVSKGRWSRYVPYWADEINVRLTSH